MSKSKKLNSGHNQQPLNTRRHSVCINHKNREGKKTMYQEPTPRGYTADTSFSYQVRVPTRWKQTKLDPPTSIFPDFLTAHRANNGTEKRNIDNKEQPIGTASVESSKHSCPNTKACPISHAFQFFFFMISTNQACYE